MEALLDGDLLAAVVEPLVILAEAGSILVIAIGAAIGFVRFVRAAIQSPHGERFVTIRLGLGRYLTLGLEFLLAADIMRTAIRPSFNEIGQLAAIAGIRTVLAFFLEQEMRREQHELEDRVQEQRAGGKGSDDDTD